MLFSNIIHAVRGFVACITVELLCSFFESETEGQAPSPGPTPRRLPRLEYRAFGAGPSCPPSFQTVDTTHSVGRDLQKNK